MTLNSSNATQVESYALVLPSLRIGGKKTVDFALESLGASKSSLAVRWGTFSIQSALNSK